MLVKTRRQLTRVIKRCGIGLGRTGSHFSNGSGDIVIGFTTAHQIPHKTNELVEVRAQLLKKFRTQKQNAEKLLP